MDFWRLMSFYFGGIGHYLSSVLTVLAIWLLVYLMLGLALFEREKIGDRPIVPQGLLQVGGDRPYSSNLLRFNNATHAVPWFHL